MIQSPWKRRRTCSNEIRPNFVSRILCNTCFVPISIKPQTSYRPNASLTPSLTGKPAATILRSVAK